MGLDTTHDAFHGAYSAFNRFRQIVAKAAGGSFPPHDDPELDRALWYMEDLNSMKPGLRVFLNHSDCDGEISPDDCLLVAEAMEALLPKIAELDDGDVGHIAREGGFVAVTKKFIAGCRLAAENGETLEFSSRKTGGSNDSGQDRGRAKPRGVRS